MEPSRPPTMAQAGFHVDRTWSAAPGLAAQLGAAYDFAAGAGQPLGCVQVFVAHTRRRALLRDAGPPVADFLARHRLWGVAHGTYLDAPWGDKRAAALPFIRAELEACRAAGLAGLVLHLGTQPPGALRPVLEEMRAWHAAAPGLPRLYLETPHVLPARSHYESPAKLEALCRDLDPAVFGLCVDTAHLWSCGVDLGSRAAAAPWAEGLRRLQQQLPLLLHVNDSARGRGDGVDKHAALGRGQIWAGRAGAAWRDSGLAVFAEHAGRHGTPAVMERHGEGEPLRRELASDLEIWSSLARP